MTGRATVHGGFTLVEVMIVLVLVGVLAATILPEMKGSYEEALLRSSGRTLLSVLQLAHSQAVSLSLPHRVRLDPATGRYAIERSGGAEAAGAGVMAAAALPGRVGQIDQRIALEVRRSGAEGTDATPPEDRLESLTEAPARSASAMIAFHPDGTADAAEIILHDRQGFGLALRVNPTTARVRVVELDRE